MNQHTPGPWRYKWEDEEKKWAIVIDEHGNIVANVNTGTGPDLPPLVARKMPAEANARLIVASPKLLDIVQQFTADSAGNYASDFDHFEALEWLKVQAREILAEVEHG